VVFDPEETKWLPKKNGNISKKFHVFMRFDVLYVGPESLLNRFLSRGLELDLCRLRNLLPTFLASDKAQNA
jgi:hypothetical protein